MKTDAERLARIERAVGKIAEIVSVSLAVQIIALTETNPDRTALIDMLRKLSSAVNAIDREFSEAEEGE